METRFAALQSGFDGISPHRSGIIVRLKSCFPVPDFKTVNRTVTSPLSLIPGTLLLAVILLAQKIIALLGL